MQEFIQENFQKSLNKAKEIMGNSKNKSHGLNHAKAVEFNALNIFNELKSLGAIDNKITQEMVIVAAWWHDAYISAYSQLNLIARHNEDVKSAKIFKEFNKDLIPQSILKKIEYSISVYNHPINYFFQNKDNYNFLTQILLEADSIEGMDFDRTKEAYKVYPRFLYKLGQKTYARTLYKKLQKLPQSEYSQKMFKLKLKDY